ncbi:LPS-assembly protein LptD [Chelatococcus sambhunathii]|uniref:LPS-assembly protein LptD n=1 Tax=Chelatococcus sambhunathii TaxID=363953 RepID=A0ABU1DAM7_9HYPH|nr:LPS-assembly protein LptD [Chelatococcus sambhunathii]MDR4305110.1 LPS-assembly protein LptD [Chelatococcus sambhunathii]
MTRGVRRIRPAIRLAATVAAAGALSFAAIPAAVAIEAGLPSAGDLLPPKPKPKKYGPTGTRPIGSLSDVGTRKDPNAKMLMEAKELVYDYDREIVTAVGRVDIYYDGRALQADKVVYSQKTNRVVASGAVKLTERNGNIVYAENLDITDNFRDGLIRSLRIETPNETHLAAAQAKRENGQLSVFDRAVYTACQICRENPEKPPLWQIKAKRIIWREDEKMVYYESATFEFMGQPIAWVPFFSSPDPTVKRKSGLLAPSVSHAGDVGYLIETPYFWALSPTSDLTLTPVTSTKQGVMLKGEYRQQLMDGAFNIRAAGIHQLNTDEFYDKVPPLYKRNDPTQLRRRQPQDVGLTVGPGSEEDRWVFSTKGDFDINERWKWGWDINAVSDKWVRSDYNLWGSPTDATSTIYLSGQGNRSWFEARAYQFYGMTRYDRQDRLPWVAPVIDYNYTVDEPVAGGEFSFNLNATNLYRDEFDTAQYRTRLQPRAADGSLMRRPDNALVGAEGTYNRISLDAQWRRRFIDPIGQVWTPFAFVRGDLIYTDPSGDPRMGPFLDARQDALFRGMAGAGLEYRYPFIAHTSFGDHQIEPIAQIILRPNETDVGRLPNEDAQSLLFDDTVLFSWDKFSGYDRIEGGSRVNVGGQYTWTTGTGATFAVLAGQSYQIMGRNSFEAIDATRTAIDTGLDKDKSDYVGGVSFAPNAHLGFDGHFRFDEDGFKFRSAEIAARAQFERWQANVIYGRYDQQPLQGYDYIREGVLAGGRVYVKKDIYVEGGARYNFDDKEFDRTQIGFGLDDIQQCLSLAFSYIRQVDTTTETVRTSQIDHRFLLKVDFRTLGGVSLSTRNRSGPSDSEGFGSTGPMSSSSTRF